MNVRLAEVDEAVDLASKLAKVWSRTLGIEDIKPDDDFFELGGDSIAAATVAMELEELVDFEIDVVQMFETPIFSDFLAILQLMTSRPCVDGLVEGVL